MRKPKTERKIKFHYLEPAFFPHKELVRETILKVFRTEGKVLKAANFIFCSDAYLLKLNKEYLGHDYYTDIITFDLSPDLDAIVADIYISSDRVKANAEGLRVPRSEEYLRVIIHGALHLCGRKDKREGDIKIMRELEDHFLKMHKRKLG